MADPDTHRSRPLRLALGPVQYFWKRERMLAFYEQVCDWPVDIVYLGEVVCAKRRELRFADWLALGRQLVATGKEVVLSTLTLLEAASELGATRRVCANGQFPVEANDMAAVNLLTDQNREFIGGSTLNLYNHHSLERLAALGMRRWVPPLELSGETIRQMIAAAPPGLECELFAWGRLPLAWSARCYTARAENRPKDHCDMACLRDPDGRLMHTRDDQPFLVLNGIQTQSALTLNLASHLDAIRKAGISVLRLSPQLTRMQEVVGHFRALLDGLDPDRHEALAGLAPVGCCDGYWQGEPGFLVSTA